MSDVHGKVIRELIHLVFRWGDSSFRDGAVGLVASLKIIDHIRLAHYSDVIMSVMASQITGVSFVYSTVCSGAVQRETSKLRLAFVGGIHRWPVNSPHKWPVTRKMFPFDDVIMQNLCLALYSTQLMARGSHRNIHHSLAVKERDGVSLRVKHFPNVLSHMETPSGPFY